jgi:hypothetical protein
MDVDNMEIRFTRAAIEFKFENQTLPMLPWNRGSNEYVAKLSADLLVGPGTYVLLVTANSGWSATAGQSTTCELLRHTVFVEVGSSNTRWILIGAVATTAVIVGGVFMFLWRRRHALQGILMMLFSEASELLGALCMQLGDLAADGITCYRILHGTINVPSDGYKAAYAIFMCLSTLIAIVSASFRILNARSLRAHMKELTTADHAAAATGQLLTPGARVFHSARGWGRLERLDPEEPRGKHYFVTFDSGESHHYDASSLTKMKFVSEARLQAQKYAFELVQTRRSINIYSLGIMTVVLQGAST